MHQILPSSLFVIFKGVNVLVHFFRYLDCAAVFLPKIFFVFNKCSLR